MKNEEIEKIMKNISLPRIKTYEELGFPDRDSKLLYAYFAIQEISSHFLVPLQVIEICLRNSIHSAVGKKFERQHPNCKWYDLVRLSEQSSRMLNTAKRKTREECGRNYSDDDLVSNLMFGFWVYMLDEQHRDLNNPYNFWNTEIGNVFPNRKGKKIKNIFIDLKRINITRNRLSHHEPIWKKRNNGTVCYLDAIRLLENEYNKVIEVLEWLAPEKKKYMLRLGFEERFKKCCNKYKSSILWIEPIRNTRINHFVYLRHFV
ncbi:hypothetical protein FBG13_17620 [Cobetia marina]|uniref:hypothetical protein n=1 Tax=Cobetia marina TaxID=28258 RepID=UPI0010ADB78E|nr:hypothetical protein [Cobetia marina]TKD59218.1 hypothetical protein FBG13_17620 [Cobetia marina]